MDIFHVVLRYSYAIVTFVNCFEQQESCLYIVEGPETFFFTCTICLFLVELSEHSRKNNSAIE
jgi:hypothetical protein